MNETHDFKWYASDTTSVFIHDQPVPCIKLIYTEGVGEAATVTIKVIGTANVVDFADGSRAIYINMPEPPGVEGT